MRSSIASLFCNVSILRPGSKIIYKVSLNPTDKMEGLCREPNLQMLYQRFAIPKINPKVTGRKISQIDELI
jgi:hypothetical protein